MALDEGINTQLNISKARLTAISRYASLLLGLNALPACAASNANTDAAELAAAITVHMQNEREFPLESTLKSLRVPNIAAIEASRNGADGECVWPRQKPDAMSKDEWRALRRSVMPGIGENGCGSYMLIDMNDDGHRDLLQRTYEGGTGLFTYYSAWKRVGTRFIAVKHKNSATDDETDELFSTNDRGANQWHELIRINGRIYVAYVDGSFGQDNVLLLRPLERHAQAATLKVEYRYRFSVPLKQRLEESDKQNTTNLSRELQKTFETALARHTGNTNSANQPTLCPVPPDISDDKRLSYSSYGAGHYSYETVIDFPIWWQGHCHIARLIDWFGQYDRKNGLNAMLSVRRTEGAVGGLEYEVHARRRAIAVRVVPNSSQTN